MKRAGLIFAVALSACASPMRVEEVRTYERGDSLRALFGEELTVCVDDLRIIPPDSIRPRVEAARVRIERSREAQVETQTAERAVAEVEEEPRPQTPRLRPVCLAAAAGFILGLLIRRRR